MPVASAAEASKKDNPSDRSGSPAENAIQSFEKRYGKKADRALDEILTRITEEIPEFETHGEHEARHWKAIRWYAAKLERVEAGTKSRFKRKTLKETELPAERAWERVDLRFEDRAVLREGKPASR